MKKLIFGILGIVTCVGISLISPPPEMTATGMRFFGLVIWLICWLAGGVMPEFMVGIGLLALSVLTGICTLPEAFAPFSNETTWLLVGAFGIGYCLKKSGLLTRIAYSIMKLFPESYTGQLFVLYFTGLLISPLMPSMTAKATLLCPLAIPAAEAFGYQKESKGLTGLFMSSYWSAGLLGNFFFTGSVYVGIMCGCLSAEEAAKVTFFSWLKLFWPAFLVIAVGGFFAIRLIYAPKGGASLPKGFAREKLRELGPISKDEIRCLVVLILVVLGWLTSSYTGVSNGICAVLGMIVLSLMNQIDARGFGAGIPWSAISLIAAITFMANMMSAQNIPAWLCRILTPVLGKLVVAPIVLVVIVGVLGFLLRWGVASIITTGTILFALFSGFAVSMGVHPLTILFIGFLSAQNWPFAAYNTTFLAGLTCMNDTVRFSDVQKMSFVYSALVVFAGIANAPLWKAFGML